jgi:hypothetical protein
MIRNKNKKTFAVMRRVAVFALLTVCALLLVLVIFGSDNFDKLNNRSFNRQFLAELKNRCDFASNECRLSLRDLFSGAENIYFVDKMGAAFEKCTIFHASNDLKRLYTPLCQYVLFEKHGEIAAYLRGFCMSDIREEGDKVGFSPTPSKFFGNFFVAKMNANEQIVVSRDDDTNRQGLHIYSYSIQPTVNSLQIIEQDKCIGSSNF